MWWQRFPIELQMSGSELFEGSYDLAERESSTPQTVI